MPPAHRSRIGPPPASPEQQRRNEIPLQIQVPSPLLIDMRTPSVRVRRRVSGDFTFDLCLLGGDGTISQFTRAPIPRFFSNNREMARFDPSKSVCNNKRKQSLRPGTPKTSGISGWREAIKAHAEKMAGHRKNQGGGCHGARRSYASH